jgi:formyl-CoA transferase
MHDNGVPAGKVYRAPDMLEDPHFAAREAIVDTKHPDFGTLRMQNVAPKLTETPGRVHSAAPTLGQHNDEVYRGLLKLDDARIDKLRADGVI